MYPGVSSGEIDRLQIWGDQHFSFAWGHGGQLIVLLDQLDMVIVTTADPFFGQHNDDSWQHEKATFNLVGDFIKSLPAK